ncbi:MAG: hypothetical protein ACE5K3_02135 [bacterium]
MILKSGEEKRREEEGTVQEFKWAGSPEESLQGKGKLYLTTHRLIMERESEGKTTRIFEFPLKGVQQVKTKGLFSKILSLEVNLSEVESDVKKISASEKKGFGTLQIKVTEPKAWASEIGFRSRKE